MLCESLDGLLENGDSLKGTRLLSRVDLPGLGRDNHGHQVESHCH